MAARYSARVSDAAAAAAGWHDAERVEDLPAVVLPDLLRLIGGDASGWNDIDVEAGRLRLLTHPHDVFDAAGIDLLVELLDEHPMLPPLVADPWGRPISWRDVIDRAQLRRRRIYPDFYRPNGVGSQLCFMFSLEPFIGIAINRPRDDFSARDRDLAALLRPHLRSAYRSVAARQRSALQLAALAREAEPVAGGVVALSPRGEVEHATPAARRILRRWFAAAPGRAALPDALAGIDAAGREFRRPEARLTVGRLDCEPPVLVLEEERLRPDPARARALGLTRREAQVLSLVAAGLTNAAIAAELFLSPSTVANHLGHAYAKLGTSCREDAAALLLRAPEETGRGAHCGRRGPSESLRP